jgi:hypothetical protein
MSKRLLKRHLVRRHKAEAEEAGGGNIFVIIFCGNIFAEKHFGGIFFDKILAATSWRDFFATTFWREFISVYLLIAPP